MTKDPFFDHLKLWSKRKHRFLEKYLTPFSAKVGSWAKDVYCIDGFAGAAKYDDGSLGSPLIMAELSDKCATWSNPVTLHLINVEAKTDHFISLQEATMRWTQRGIVSNFQGEFGRLIPNMLAQIGNAPALFFIDPYGPTKVRFSDLRQILQRGQDSAAHRGQKATELIINFDADGLRRIADTMHGNKPSMQTTKAVTTNLSNVKDIIGSNLWYPQFEQGGLTTEKREQILLGEYLSNLSKYGHYVIAYAIRKKLNASPQYYLVYCTRHIDGIVLMNNFVCEEDDNILGETVSRIQGSFFDPVADEVSQRRDILKDIILRYLLQNTGVNRGKVKKSLILSNFGKFHEKDYNNIFQLLLEQGKLKAGHGRNRINDNEPLTYLP